MEDRLKINGEWYVREDLIDSQHKVDKMKYPAFFSKSALYEDDEVCMQMDFDLHSGRFISLEIIRKPLGNYEEEDIDNDVYIKNIINRSNIAEFKDDFPWLDYELVREFLIKSVEELEIEL